jgi:holo-[acyl-carrier protein] synthase
MIIGIGTDIVSISRFERCTSLKRETLLKVFAPGELDYAYETPAKTAERLAVRFAAKEAFYKAASSLLSVPFARCAPYITVRHEENKAPQLVIDWPKLGLSSPKHKLHLSLSHSETNAIAFAVIEEQK